MKPCFLPRLAFVSLLALSVALPAYAQQQEPGTGPNYETRLSGIEDQMRTLNGRVEELEFNVRRLDQTLQRLQGDYDSRLSRIEAAQATQQAAPPVAALPPAPSAVPDTADTTPPPPAGTPPVSAPPVNPVGNLGNLHMQNGKIVSGSVNPQAPPLPNAPSDYGLTPQEQYDHAFGLLRQANYDEAEKSFKAFIDKNPKDKLIDNAKYWYGETLYVRGRFEEASIAFADAYQQNPQGTKAPDSLLKLAMSLNGQQKTADACVTLGELKSKYPNASASVRARADEQRTKLKCGAQ